MFCLIRLYLCYNINQSKLEGRLLKQIYQHHFNKVEVQKYEQDVHLFGRIIYSGPQAGRGTRVQSNMFCFVYTILICKVTPACR